MNSYARITLKFAGLLLVGALGALVFNVFLLPYMLTNPYFERFDFIKSFKQGTIIVNPRETIYVQEDKSIENSLERVRKSVVAIESSDKNLTSGLIATSDGNILTLASAVPRGRFNVFVEGKPVDFQIAKIDFENNLALIETGKKDLQSVGFSSNGNIKLGQKVFLTALSSPSEDIWLANQGIVSEISDGIIKTNISENRAVTGSPLFNSSGELVGLVYIDAGGRISAVPAGTIKIFLGL